MGIRDRVQRIVEEQEQELNATVDRMASSPRGVAGRAAVYKLGINPDQISEGQVNDDLYWQGGEAEGSYFIEGIKDVIRNTLEGAAVIAEPGGIPFTAEEYEAQRATEDIVGKQELEHANVIANELREVEAFEALQADPSLMENPSFINEVVRTVPQVLGQAIVSIASGGTLSLPFMGAQIVGSSYQNNLSGIAEKLYDGDVNLLTQEDKDRAKRMSMVNAAVQAPMEQIGISKATKFFKLKSKIGAAFKRIGKAGMTEGLTESLQEFPDAITNLLAEEPDKGMLEALWEIVKDPQTYKDAARSGAIGAILGGGIKGTVESKAIISALSKKKPTPTPKDETIKVVGESLEDRREREAIEAKTAKKLAEHRAKQKEKADAKKPKPKQEELKDIEEAVATERDLDEVEQFTAQQKLAEAQAKQKVKKKKEGPSYPVEEIEADIKRFDKLIADAKVPEVKKGLEDTKKLMEEELVKAKAEREREVKKKLIPDDEPSVPEKTTEDAIKKGESLTQGVVSKKTVDELKESKTKIEKIAERDPESKEAVDKIVKDIDKRIIELEKPKVIVPLPKTKKFALSDLKKLARLSEDGTTIEEEIEIPTSKGKVITLKQAEEFEKTKAKLEERGKGKIVLKKDDGEVVDLKTYADRIAKGETIKEKKESLEEVTEEGKAKGQVAKRAEKAGERAKQAREAKAKREAELKEAEVGLNPAQKNEIKKNVKKFQAKARAMTSQNPKIQDDLANAAAVAAAEHIKIKGNLKDFNPALSMLNWINEQAGAGIGGRAVAKELKGKIAKGDAALAASEAFESRIEQESGFEQDQIEEDARQLGLELDADRQTPVEMSDRIDEYVERKASEGDVDMGPLLALKERAGTLTKEMTPRSVMKLTRQERIARYVALKAKEKTTDEPLPKHLLDFYASVPKTVQDDIDRRVEELEREDAGEVIETEPVKIPFSLTDKFDPEEAAAAERRQLTTQEREVEQAKVFDKPVQRAPEANVRYEVPKKTRKRVSVDEAVRGKSLEQESEWRKEAKSKRRGNIPVKESKMVGLEVHGKNRAVNDVNKALEANTPFSRVAGKMLKKHKTDTIVVPNAAYGKRHGLYDDKVKKVLKSSYGVYDASTNTVYINAAALSTVGNKNIQNITQRTIAHEALHSVIFNTVQKMNPNQYKAAMRKVRVWWSDALNHLPQDAYVDDKRVRNFLDVMRQAESFAQLGQMREANAKFEEALTYPFTDPKVATFLNSIPAPPSVRTSKIKSVWDWFLNHMFKNVLGIPKKTGTALTELTNIASSMYQIKVPKPSLADPMQQARANMQQAAPGIAVKVDAIGDGETTIPKDHVQFTVHDSRSVLNGHTMTSQNNPDAMRERLKAQKLLLEGSQSAIGTERGKETFINPSKATTLERRLWHIPFDAYTEAVDRVLGGVREGIDYVAQTTSRTGTVVDAILRKTVTNYGEDANIKELKYQNELNMHRDKIRADDLARQILEVEKDMNEVQKPKVQAKLKAAGKEFSEKGWERAVQARLLQLAEGGLSPRDDVSTIMRRVNEKFADLEQNLRDEGLLADHQFKTMVAKERAVAINRIAAIEKEIEAIDPDEMTEKEATKRLTDLNKERVKLITRLQIHYKNSGVNYIRHIKDKITAQNYMRGRYTLDAMGRKWSKQRGNWHTSYDSETDTVTVKKRKVTKLKDTAWMVSKGITQEAHDLHLYRTFDALATSESRMKVTKNAKGENRYTIDGVKVFRPYATEIPDYWGGTRYYRRMPNNSNFGNLAGMWVEKHVFDTMQKDLKEVSEVRAAYDKYYKAWKKSKTVMNPATQIRNFGSNIALAHILGDTDPGTIMLQTPAVIQLMRDIYAGKPKNELARALREDTTIFHGETLFGSEMSGDMWEAVANAAAKKDKTKFIASMLNLGPKMYEASEVFFKVNVFLNTYKKNGGDVQHAAAKAQKALFNYSEIPPAIRWARNWYAPFATFAFKAIPNVAHQAVRKPWKALPYYGLLYATNLAANAVLDDDDDRDERRYLPDYVNRSTLGKLGIPSHVRMPFTIAGREQWFDISYWLPWGDANSEGEGMFERLGVPRVLTPNHPVLGIGSTMMANKDLFFGDEVLLETDLPGERALKFVEILWNRVSPTPAFLDTNKVKKITRAYYGDKDVLGETPDKLGVALLDTLMGIKLRNFDYMEEFMWRNRELQDQANEIRQQQGRQLNQLLTRQSDRYTDEEVAEKMDEIMRTYDEKNGIIMDKYMRLFLEENDR
jgi:hypothetical protein